MAVKIKGMEMPKGCRRCRYCSYHHILHLYECKLTGSQMIPYSYKRRDEECPLEEVK